MVEESYSQIAFFILSLDRVSDLVALNPRKKTPLSISYEARFHQGRFRRSGVKKDSCTCKQL